MDQWKRSSFHQTMMDKVRSSLVNECCEDPACVSENIFRMPSIVRDKRYKNQSEFRLHFEPWDSFVLPQPLRASSDLYCPNQAEGTPDTSALREWREQRVLLLGH